MNVLETVAEFVANPRFVDHLDAARSERIKLHVLDTVGALVAGAGVEEGAALAALRASAPLACACATARCTELDDIHLSSCTTPGSVIVPTALSLAGELGSWAEFAAAILAGYELMIRLGFAADGPALLGKRIWPTQFTAAFGSAAVASRALQLNPGQTAGALATALSFCTGASSPANSKGSSRWLTLGAAAAGGVLASRGAAQGLLGSTQIWELNSGRIAGVEISEARLLDQLGTRFLFEELGMKPFPVARQSLAAIEAARELVNAEKIEAASISEIVIGVPAAQLRVIDHPGIPTTRMGSIVSVQYQIALALLAPERLLEVHRSPPFVDDGIRELMRKVRVQRALELEQYYPDTWPGLVEIIGRGHTYRQTVLYPRGDARNSFDRETVIDKFKRLTEPRLGVAGAAGLVEQILREAAPLVWSSAF